MFLQILNKAGQSFSSRSRNLLKRILLVVLVLIFPLQICDSFSNNDRKPLKESSSMQNISLNSRENPMTISRLQHLCGTPGKCGEAMACEGKSFWVVGMIDYDNVFDQQNYPQFPYEKFRLFSPEDGNMLEVFVETDKNSFVFQKIHEHAGNDMNVIVYGRISGFDFPTMQDCRRGIALILIDSKFIMFKR